jgi:hypothetical protein
MLHDATSPLHATQWRPADVTIFRTFSAYRTAQVDRFARDDIGDYGE